MSEKRIQFKGFSFFVFFLLIELCWILGTKVSEMLLDLMVIDIDINSIQIAESYYHYAVAATVLFWGIIIDRNPEKRKLILLISNIIWIISSILMYFLPINFGLYLLVQIAWGIGFGANGALVGSYLGDLLHVTHRGRLFSLFMIFIYLIKGASIAVNGLIGNMMSNWKAPTFIFAILGLIFLGLFFFFCKDPKIASIEPEFKDKIEKGFEYKHKLSLKSALKVIKVPTNILFMLQGVTGMIGVTIVTRYLNYWVTSETGMGMDTNIAVILLGTGAGLGALFGLYFAGKWADREFNRNKLNKMLFFAICNLFLQVIAYFILTMVLQYPDSINPIYNNWSGLFQAYPVFIGFIITMNLCIFFGTSIAPTVGTARTHINLPENRGTAAALYDLFDFIGSGIALIIGSTIYTVFQNYQITIMLGSLFWIISGGIWIIISLVITKDYRKVRLILKERAENE
ncbi:MAG: MFS transporter [archaeon]|nr:MFS transporter [archaeon]